ncbi:MAG TPA: AMMECR1 domain-containing protein [Geobacteraceae bacterium]|nr:AMMECR1 domain-containing protein [Geobacteraceae bacterium]
MKYAVFPISCGIILIIVLSLAGPDAAQSGSIPPAPPAKERRNTAAAAQIDPHSILSDPGLKSEILNYAKGVFQARLGYAKIPEPPLFLTKVQRACFVTFFSAKRVIACFGGFNPRTGNVADEIAENIRLALTFDSRARYVDRKSALSAGVQITFPEEPSAVTSYAEVDPSREGLLVENDHNGVAIVPGEAKTASWAFREAMRRLGEKDRSRVRIFKFQAFAVSSRK